MILEFYLEFEDVKPVFITIIILSRTRFYFTKKEMAIKHVQKTFIIRFVPSFATKWQQMVRIPKF
jgi:hypothetical protein